MFTEFSAELVFFVKKLHVDLLKNNQKSVFFLAREGQFLKVVFDLLVKKEGSNISSFYFEVSRSSTFLPSLKELEKEKFSTLFRQYNSISALEFLQNLNLESLEKNLTNELNVSQSRFRDRIENFQESHLFSQIINSKLFTTEYELKRTEQSQLLIRYIKQFDDLKSNNFNIVDVGWKGTIQDHLGKVIERHDKNIITTGYYMGLLYPTLLSTNSTKKGLIFSIDDSHKSYKFDVFNENRALYELILSANHGSAKNYIEDSNGCVTCAHQEFVEKDQFFSLIEPVQTSLLSHVTELINSGEYISIDFKELARKHDRLVFSPTENEKNWFENVFQFENFGLFENTKFTSSSSWMSKFTIGLKLLKGNKWILGFWPYVYIEKLYGNKCAKIYAYLQRKAN